jgi:hypothetical protein
MANFHEHQDTIIDLDRVTHIFYSSLGRTCVYFDTGGSIEYEGNQLDHFKALLVKGKSKKAKAPPRTPGGYDKY